MCCLRALHTMDGLPIYCAVWRRCGAVDCRCCQDSGLHLPGQCLWPQPTTCCVRSTDCLYGVVLHFKSKQHYSMVLQLCSLVLWEPACSKLVNQQVKRSQLT
jgi:hypothetical protein